MQTELFYNTIELNGHDLTTAVEDCKKQEEKVLALFKKYGKLSPSQVWQMGFTDCPITSVRRAITNLTKRGKLFKTDEKIIGLYQHPEHFWIIKL